MPTTATIATIAPAALAERLATGTTTALLDVRDDASWTVDAPAATVVHVPAERALAAAPTLARDLPNGVIVVCNRGISAARVAERLRAEGNPAVVLEGGMRGWITALRAVPVDLGLPHLRVLQIQRPGRGCLSYLLAAGDEALVVDPAPQAAFYLAEAARLGVRITAVFDTHVHADHLSGARALAATADAPLLLPRAALDRDVVHPPAQTVADGDVIAVGDVALDVVALPGHTSDMTGLVVPGRAIVAGDSLFADGIARPDLQEEDPVAARAMARRLHATLHERVLALGDDVVLLPGHDHPIVRSGPVAPTLGIVRQRLPELALDADAFADELVRDLPPRPANHRSVIAVNSGHAPFDAELETGGNSCASR